MSSWINLAAKEVTIVFFDQGVGIPKTLKPDKYERIIAALKNITKLKFSAIPGDGEMIAAATEYHRSSKDQNGGRGFQDMKQFINACQEGELRVLSNRGNYYYVSKDEEGYSSAAQSLGGTVIQWRFRNEGKVEMIDA